MRKWLPSEGAVGKDPEGNKTVGESKNDAKVKDASPWLWQLAGSDDEQYHDKGDGVGFNECFFVSVEVAHAEDWCEDVAEDMRVIVEVLYAGSCARGVFELKPFISFKVEHEEGESR